MTVTLNLPSSIEQAYWAEAQARGISLDALVQDLLLSHQSAPASDELSPEEWVIEFKKWVRSHDQDNLPILSDEAISRDFIYQERGL